MHVLECPPVCSEETVVRKFITELLVSSACPKCTMNIDQLDGYLRAVAAEPQPCHVNDWMPLIFGGELPLQINNYSAEFITNALISLYNPHRTQVLNGTFELLFQCEYTPNRADRTRSEQWARGFMQGYIFWQDIWSQYVDENQTGLNQAAILPSSAYDEIDDILAIIGAIADTDYAMQTGAKPDDLKLMFNRLPEKVIEYGRIAHIIRTKVGESGSGSRNLKH